MAQVYQDLPSRVMTLPVSGAGTNVAAGALLMAGATGGTNIGVLTPFTASSNTLAVGVLTDLHYTNTTNKGIDCTYNSAAINMWPAYAATPAVNKVHILDNLTLVRAEFDLSATGLAVASATTTVITITSYEQYREDCFVYCRAGTGIGQLGFIRDAASSGSCTLHGALTTTLDSTSKLTSILPFFYDKVVWKVSSGTAETKLDSTAAVGTGRMFILGRNIVRNGMDENLDNLAHHNLQGLNSLNQLIFYHLGAIVDTGWHRIA